MKRTLKIYVTGLLSAFLLMGLATGVFAFTQSRNENITVTFNNIGIEVNGQRINPTDAAGAAVEPFIWGGTTYLPVRAVSETFGMDVRWDAATQTVHLEGTPSLQTSNNQTADNNQTTPTTDNRRFEDSFVNTPLDARWNREGNLTFDGLNGMSFGGGVLTLDGFSVANSNNYTIEFQSAILNPRVTSSALFGISLGTNANDRAIEWLFVYPRGSSGVWHNATTPSISSNSAGSRIANFQGEGDMWYNIKVDVVNDQAHLFIDGSLITSVNLSSPLNKQISIGGSTAQAFNIRNFSVTIND